MEERRGKWKNCSEKKKYRQTESTKNDVRNIESKRRRAKIPIMINNSAGIKARARTPTLLQRNNLKEQTKKKTKVES